MRAILKAAITGAALVAGLSAGPALPVAPARDAFAQRFAAPLRADRAWLRWWWPGGDVTDAELGRELGVMDEAGFGGAEVQPFNPGLQNLTPEARSRVNDYATPGFFARMRSVTRDAARRGMAIDYTFGSAWPTGGGFAITPERALRELTMARTEVAGGAGGPIRIALPTRSSKFAPFGPLDPRAKDPAAAGWQQRFDAIDRIVAVVAVKGAAPTLKPESKGGFRLFPWRDVLQPGQLDPASAVVLTDRMKPDGTLDWTPPAGIWQVFAFREFAVNSGISAGVGAGPQLVADHFDATAFAAHAARVGDPLIAALGPGHPGLHGSFIDSLELMPDIYWSRDFLAQFRARRGYDLTPYLPFVLQPGWMQAWGDHYSPPYFDAADIGDRVRADYRQTVSDLLVERFIKPFVDWNHAHGLKARFQAHGAPVDTLLGYGLADIPETEDLAGHNPYFMRLARAAGNIYGRPIISAEALCWANEPFSVTLARLRREADLIFASGVNRLVIHGFPYAYQRDRWPGWHAFGPIGFSKGFSTFLAEANPLWAGVPRLAAYLARTQAVLQQGKSVVPVALFLGETGYYEGIETKGRDGDALVRGLLERGYDSDRINADGLLHARVVGGGLVTAGGHRYGALVLPPIEGVSTEVAERLSGFAKAGLPLFFVDSAPRRDRGLRDHVARDARVVAAMAAAQRAGGAIVPAATLAEALAARRVAPNLRFEAGGEGLVFVERQIGARTIFLIHNAGAAARDASFAAPARGAVSRLDAMAGTITALPASAGTDGGVRVPLRLEAGETALLAIGGPPGAAAPPPGRPVAELPVAPFRTVALNGHARGGTPIVRTLPLPALTDLATLPGASDFAGAATYETRVALPAAWRGGRVMLDLGTVHDMATIAINGQPLPPLIEAPWRADVTRWLRPGENRLTITVHTTPQNAVIDPTRAGYRDLKPMPAGLIGPVVLRLLR